MKGKNILAFILSLMFMVMAVPGNIANAVTEEEEVVSTLKNGEYTIENDALHMTKDEESIARSYLNKESKLVVKDNEKRIYLYFTGKSMMNNHKVEVNNEEIDFYVEDETDDTIDISFKINDFNDSIVIYTTVFGFKDVSFRYILKEDTLKVVKLESEENDKEEIPGEETPDKEDTENKQETPDKEEDKKQEEVENPADKDIVYVPEEKPSTEAEVGQAVDGINPGVYSIANEIVSDSAIGYSAARDSLSSISRVEVKNNALYVTLGFGATNLMSNIRLSVNGSNVGYNIISRDAANNTMDIKFNIPSIDNTINVKAYIGMIERDIEFGVKFLRGTLTQLEGYKANAPVAQKSTLAVEESLGEETEKENLEESELESKGEEAELVAENYFKKYTIENEVIHDSAIGKKMARKYLAEKSIVEEVDGQYYVTLEFSGTNVMKDFVIKVNGEEVTYTVVKNDIENNIKAFRFKVNSLQDDIHVYCFISLMKMNIDFGVALKEETLTLIEENTVEAETLEVDTLTSGSKKVMKKVMGVSASGAIFCAAIIGVFIVVKRRKKA